MLRATALGFLLATTVLAQSGLTGRVLDPQGNAIARARLRLATVAEATTGADGVYRLEPVAPGRYRLTVDAPGFASDARDVDVPSGILQLRDISLALAGRRDRVDVFGALPDPPFNPRSLLIRDDQLLQHVNAGIVAGQHEGGGKSLEIRRYGFNLDHGGVNGGLKVLLDNVQQNQGTQGHGQGYLGSLKVVTPELIQEVNLINGPFSAEYGDFSGLGVVHIRLRESLPDEITARIQGGSFDTVRGFLAFSPQLKNADSFVAWEGSRTDGPFLDPLRYKRNNITANYTRHLAEGRALGFKFNGGLNDYFSSGQIPLDEVASGWLDRFGAIDSTNGGTYGTSTAGIYYRQDSGKNVFKADAFFSRSLFDLYSHFTFFLNDLENGDAIQQHDARIQEGANVQYLHPARWGSVQSLLTVGANYHDNQINVGLYPRVGRVPTGVTSRANVRVTNGAGYVQQAFGLFS